MVKQAAASQLNEIAVLDESVIGSRCRENIIRQAIENGQCYIAVEEKSIVAFGIIVYHFFDNGFIELLIVDSKYRRQGFGKQLLEAFKGLCSTEKLFTSTNSSNLPMQKLLDNCGFKRCGWIDELDEGDPELIYCFKNVSRDMSLDT